MIIGSFKDIDRTKYWHMILYAKAGQGKTTAVNYMPGKTLVLDLDNSSRVLAGNINAVPYRFDDGTKAGREFDRSQPIEEMNSFLADKEVHKLGDSFDNLVIDNVSSFEKDWFVEKGRSSHNGISNELQDYSQWTNYFARIVTTIYMIPNVNIMITAWEKQRDITTEEGQTFNQYAPDIRPNNLNGFLGLADVVGRLIINPKTNARGVILSGNDGIYAKNRLDDRTAAPIEELFNFGAPQKQPTKTTQKKEGNE